MNITKLKSGNYRVRQMIDGIVYSKTIDHRPTKREAREILITLSMDAPGRDMSLEKAMQRYIEIKSHVLSPSTLAAYERYIGRYPYDARIAPISRFTEESVQVIVNDLSARYSPKYARNLAGFLTAVFRVFRPGLSLYLSLPKIREREIYIPTDDDMQRILERIEGTEYEIPITLAAFGLRRGEICALTMDDIGCGTIRVNKSKVVDSSGVWHIRPPKTKASNRIVCVPEELTDRIRAKGYVYVGNPNSIYRFLRRIEAELEIPAFPLHKLRHYFASSAHSMGIPDEYIMKAGGWKTDSVMKGVYRHAEKGKYERMYADYFVTNVSRGHEKPGE